MIKPVKTGVLERKVHKSLGLSVAHVLVKTPYDAIGQCADNAHDSDADNFRVNVDLESGLLAMSDDGESMDERGIQQFVDYVGSFKKDKKPTRKGRTPIGNFGFGASSRMYLGDYCFIEAMRDCTRITREEWFVSEQKAQTLRYPNEVSVGHHGTNILIKKLRFDKSTFSVGGLVEYLQWSEPCIPDFNIYVNGVRVPKREVLMTYREHVFEETVPNIGVVRGSVFYNPKGVIRNSGILWYVHGKAVGDADPIDVSTVGSFMARKILGIVDIDGADPFISFDRGGFNKNIEGYSEAKGVVRDVLKNISKDITGESRSVVSTDSKLRRIVETALKNVESTINRRLLQDLDGPVSIAPVFGNGFVSDYDPASRVVRVNIDTPMFSIQGIPDRHQASIIENTILFAALSGIAESNVSENYPNSQDDIAQLHGRVITASEPFYHGNMHIRGVVKEIMGKEGRVLTSEEAILNPYRLYTLNDIPDVTGLSINTVKLLYLAGTLEPISKKDNRFRDVAIRAALDEIEGMVPIGEVLDPEGYNQPIKGKITPAVLDHREGKHESLADLGFVYNVGRAASPFYWVERERAEELQK